MLFSVKIAEKTGYTTLIRIASFIFVIGITSSAFASSCQLFIICFFGIAGTCYGISAIPTLNCMWSHFSKKDTGKVSGIAFFFFSISSLIFTFIIFQVTNPDNRPGSISYKETASGDTVYLFDESISSKLPSTIIIMAIIVGISIIVGAFMITKKERIGKE